MSNHFNLSISGTPPSLQQSETSPGTGITAVEAASILHLTLQTVLNLAASGKLSARIPDDMSFTYDDIQNYLICLEGLPHKA